MYDMISLLSLVRYDLAFPFVTMSILRLFVYDVYDINLGATTTTIRSIRGVQIPISLVTSATDSFK